MKHFFTFILCSFLLILNRECSAKQLHAIIVADTRSDMGSITMPDVKQLQKELRSVAKHTKVNLKETVFSGPTFNRVAFKAFLQGLSFESSDTVVFYYSGHGYRTVTKDSPLPYLAFDFNRSGVDLQWVVHTIWNKNPQFALIMADCCNNYVEAGFRMHTKNIRINLHNIPPTPEGYKRLFAQAKGCVVMCSSSEGEFSYGSPYGGLFTQCLLSSMNKEIAKPTPSWKSLFLRASSYLEHIQKPIYQILN